MAWTLSTFAFTEPWAPLLTINDLRQISKWLIQAERQQIMRLWARDWVSQWQGGCAVQEQTPPWAVSVRPVGPYPYILDSFLANDFSEES